MSNERKSTLRNVMSLAWQFVKRNGLSLSEALTIAWRNQAPRRHEQPYSPFLLP